MGKTVNITKNMKTATGRTVKVAQVADTVPVTWLNQQQAAKYLGIEDAKTFRHHAFKLLLPCYPLSQKLVLYKKSDIDEAVERLNREYNDKCREVAAEMYRMAR